MAAVTAEVQVLTAEVRVLMVGSRQVTLSVYRQLDQVAPELCEPFGRVSDANDKSAGCVHVVGRHGVTGALIRARAECTGSESRFHFEDLEERRQWCAAHRWTWAKKPARGDRLAVRTLHNECVSQYVSLPSPEGFFGSDDDGWQAIWPWADIEPASRESLKQIRKRMRQELDSSTAAYRRFDAWKTLPLIVLAGLR